MSSIYIVYRRDYHVGAFFFNYKTYTILNVIMIRSIPRARLTRQRSRSISTVCKHETLLTLCIVFV
jgi:hypothetical protein